MEFLSPRELQLSRSARQVFKDELLEAGLYKISLPDDFTRQLELLSKIDRASVESRHLGTRLVHVVERDGTEHEVHLSFEDALLPTRRTLVSRITRGTMGAAATQLERAASRLGPSEESDEIRKTIHDLNDAKEMAEEQQAREEVRLLHEERRAELKAKMADRRRDRWFTRDSIAALAGALLLLGFAAVLVVMMFQGKQPSDIISNAFLLILGFFFGQGARGGKSE